MRFLLHLVALLMLLSVSAWAKEPTVGKLDGTTAPSLAPLGSPGLTKEEKLPDSGLPTFLEKQGDWRAAAGAWETLAFTSFGDVRRHALVQAALDLAKSADHDTAARLGLLLLQGDAASGPDTPARAQIYSLLLPLAQTSSTLTTQLTTTLAAHKPSPLRNAALYRLIWQTTVTASPSTPVGNTYSLPLAQKLADQTATLDKHLRTRVQRAEIFGLLLPGLGHAWLGQPGTAAAVLPLWAFMLWLALWSLRHRQWPLLVLGALGALLLWAASPLLAANTATAQNTHLRGQAIAQWLSLQPVPLPLTVSSSTLKPALSSNDTDLPPLPGVSSTTPLSPTGK